MSFLTDGLGTIYYADIKDRAKMRVIDLNPDSHSSLAEYFKLNEDKCNKYEVLLNGDFKVDQLNTTDDSERGKAFAKRFSKENFNKEYWQLEAVRKNGYAIEYIKNPSEEMQLEAVRKNGYAIDYIKNPSEKVQLEAVRENGCAIKYIKNPSEKVQLEAVRKNGY